MKSDFGLQPTADKVLVMPLKVDEKTSGGIILPEVSKQKEQLAQRIGTLVAVGPDATDAPELFGIKLGDVILYARYSGDRFPVDGVEYCVMRVSDVVGKVTKFPDYMISGAKSSVEAFGFNEPPQAKVA